MGKSPTTLHLPAKMLTPRSTVLFASIRPRLSMDLSPCDGAASATLHSAKPTLSHLHGLRATRSTITCILQSLLETPQYGVGFSHLPLAGSGDRAKKSQRWIVPGVTGPCPQTSVPGWGETHNGVGVCNKQALGCFLSRQVAGSVRVACGGFARHRRHFLAPSHGLCHCGSAAPTQGSRATRCGVASIGTMGMG